MQISVNSLNNSLHNVKWVLVFEVAKFQYGMLIEFAFSLKSHTNAKL